MQLSPEAAALLAELWAWHQRNPINHFEYLPDEQGGALVHPASRRRVQTDLVPIETLIQAGLLRGRWQLSLTFEGIRYCQDRRSRPAERRWRIQRRNG